MASTGHTDHFDNKKIGLPSVTDEEPIKAGRGTCPSENPIEIVTNDMINDTSNSNGITVCLEMMVIANGATPRKQIIPMLTQQQQQ